MAPPHNKQTAIVICVKFFFTDAPTCGEVTSHRAHPDKVAASVRHKTANGLCRTLSGRLMSTASLLHTPDHGPGSARIFEYLAKEAGEDSLDLMGPRDTSSETSEKWGGN